MPTALTPSTVSKLSLGNRDGLVAKFTSITNLDYWVSGMSVVEHVSVTNSASGQTVGFTVSGGTITFPTSGALSNATVFVVGFK